MTEWTIKKLADVVELRRGFDLPARLRTPGGFPVLSAGITAGWHNEGPVKGPGFVVGRATNLGIPTWSDVDFWPLNTTLYAADFKGNDPRFLYHIFENIDLAGFDSGSVQPMLNRNYIADVEVRIPNLATQQAVADVFGALDDKITANESRAALAADLASTFYHSVRQQARCRTLLATLVSTQYGVTTSAVNGIGPRLLRVTDINKKPWIEWSTSPACQLSASEQEKYRLRAGDILVARMADPGKAALIDDGDPSSVFASYLVRLTAHDPKCAQYIYYFLRSNEYQEYANGASSGSVQRNMNAKVIVDTSISLPSEGMLREFNLKVSGLRKLIGAVLRESLILTRTRDELLPLLMSGKIGVRDAEKVVEGVV